MMKWMARATGVAWMAVALSAGAAEKVELQTSLGSITIELDAEKAPLSVENFLRYVDDGFYDGTIFHRVMPGFMIQGGGFTREMEQKPTREGVRNEATNGLKNRRGAVAMARTSDPHSATSQFFINVVDNPDLDHPSFDGFGYTVFGRVVDGMATVDAIRQVATRPVRGHEAVPVETVVIQSARRVAPPAPPPAAEAPPALAPQPESAPEPAKTE